ncbi:MAG TPA: transketolase [Flavobacteriales bacterium]|nr:transketolase [Flavobacteriales bacterium]
MTKEELREEILNDFRLANESREASLLGRREVLTGKAKFGIFGDGKELPQIALSKQFQPGDFRSGYYRDQTWLMAMGELTLQEFFAQLYADPNEQNDPHSAGRQMNCHFATHSLNKDGTWKILAEQKNSSADISPTAGQMARMLGLAYASKIYRLRPELTENEDYKKFSNNGDEVVFGSIGDASTSEGPFWETINAAGVLQVPLVLSVWDDGYGISVERKYQTTKGSISEVLKGFQRDENGDGYEIFRVKAWDYAQLCIVYEQAADIAREQHIPVIVHVEEVTQPQGHSTSGSHERYKTPERLAWEAEFDGIRKMREWIIDKGLGTEQELDLIQKEAVKTVREAKKAAWKAFHDPILEEYGELKKILDQVVNESSHKPAVEEAINQLLEIHEYLRRDLLKSARHVLQLTASESIPSRSNLSQWVKKMIAKSNDYYHSHLYSESKHSPLNQRVTPPSYSSDSMKKDGREILRDNFDALLEKMPEIHIFGEDAGKIGGVNQGLEGLQKKYGEIRVSDTGIREATIIGQAIGMAMRGLRPVAEIQYLDYVNYALQVMSDDLSTVRYRTKGRQMAPVIIRTRGHRLEGIWHSGSLMGMLINAVRGMHVCVPRNMTQAAGMYNTLLHGDDPGIIIESLNGYRLKEQMPLNLGEYTVPVGKVDVIKEGTDLTIVSYGSLVRMVEEAAIRLSKLGISAEVIDIQTLIPFDLEHEIFESLNKTNRLLIVDEDVPGGAAGYILSQILDPQDGYYALDSKPVLLSGTDHRPPYGTDGDYFSKPSVEDIVENAYSIMHELDPARFPSFYR